MFRTRRWRWRAMQHLKTVCSSLRRETSSWCSLTLKRLVCVLVKHRRLHVSSKVFFWTVDLFLNMNMLFRPVVFLTLSHVSITLVVYCSSYVCFFFVEWWIFIFPLGNWPNRCHPDIFLMQIKWSLTAGNVSYVKIKISLPNVRAHIHKTSKSTTAAMSEGSKSLYRASGDLFFGSQIVPVMTWFHQCFGRWEDNHLISLMTYLWLNKYLISSPVNQNNLITLEVINCTTLCYFSANGEKYNRQCLWTLKYLSCLRILWFFSPTFVW